MKALAVSLLALTSISSFAVSNVEVYTFIKFDQKEYQYDGFYASSFYPSEIRYCYKGDAQKVCDKIKDAEGIQMGKYVTGDHDYFKVESCEADHDQITAELKLNDDYGTRDLPFTAKFGECE